jgi:hypothetical protein
MNLKQQTYKMVSAWLVLALFMGVTQPSNLPVVGLILPFALLYMGLYHTWRLLSGLRLRYILAAAPERTPGRRVAVVVCLSAVLLAVLESLGQLTVRDVSTIGAIFILGYLYVARSRASSTKQ